MLPHRGLVVHAGAFGLGAVAVLLVCSIRTVLSWTPFASNPELASVVTAPVVEEIVKAGTLFLFARCVGGRSTSVVLAAGTGYALLEATLYVHHLASPLLLATRLFLTIPLHVVTLGLAMASFGPKWPWPMRVASAVLLHAAYNATLLGVAAFASL